MADNDVPPAQNIKQSSNFQTIKTTITLYEKNKKTLWANRGTTPCILQTRLTAPPAYPPHGSPYGNL